SKSAKKSKPTSSVQPFKSAEVVVESDSDNEASRRRLATKEIATPAPAAKSSGEHKATIPSARPTASKPAAPIPEASQKRKYESPSLSSTTSDGKRSKWGRSSIVPVPAPLKGAPVETSRSRTDSDASSDEDEEQRDGQSSGEEDEEDEDEESESDDELELARRKKQDKLVIVFVCILVMARNQQRGLADVRPTHIQKIKRCMRELQTTTLYSSPRIRKFWECNVLSEDYLRGKQIWHITAPASVPIDTITEVPVQKVATGEAILKHDEDDYGLVAETDATGDRKVLLIPSTDDNRYHVAGAPITRTLHLQQIVNLPSRSSDNTVAGSNERPTSHVKTVRQQPEGLCMRYRPFGDATSSDSSDGAPEFKVPPIFRPSKVKPIAQAPSNGESGSVNAAPPSKPTPSPIKPTKPEKEKSPHKKSTAKPPDTSRTPQPNRILSAAKDSPNKNGSTSMPTLTSKVTTEERAKRKAEKRRRREVKRAGGEDSPARANGNRREAETSMSEKRKKRKSDAGDETTGWSVNGSKESKSQEPDAEKVKSKRKKRKSEATVVDV
ncbi:MAG: hypothetical protein Q9174_006537, partial [Haloplaca sp. 1 TL-2023]